VTETDPILTMPRRYARILNAQFNNRVLPFPLEAPAFDTYVYWHANSAGDPADAWLRRQLLDRDPARRFIRSTSNTVDALQAKKNGYWRMTQVPDRRTIVPMRHATHLPYGCINRLAGDVAIVHICSEPHP
jgi:hypothetical protein